MTPPPEPPQCSGGGGCDRLFMFIKTVAVLGYHKLALAILGMDGTSVQRAMIVFSSVYCYVRVSLLMGKHIIKYGHRIDKI